MRQQQTRQDLIHILEKYNKEVEALREQGYLIGCANRAERMKADFTHAGVDAEIIVATTGSSYLTHESNTRWKFHHVVLSDGLVYDPNYSKKVPLSLDDYAKEVFLEKDIYLWRKGDTSMPIWPSVTFIDETRINQGLEDLK